ncbi:N-acetylglucosamine-6-phosphate deacetylase [Streptomyces cyaneochromogenes]|uniref:N-acetylglucosamine-6-phosphate deacetylase n=1 Tax=Streptomyces cyaneochromogenes TaxID=2496836 RepID=A0A3S9LZN3_9ACTN|nr:N-acetylglucosamine-6-phosphate deacetylase [Streptomyces cyaneochromogenes]AZQ32377.1 N-acetylglucosamine-6-phosphate deacetylase [Streptomyces cyaneochromogenes]
MTGPQQVIGGGRVVTPEGILDPGWVVVRNDVIESVHATAPQTATTAVTAGRPTTRRATDTAGCWLLPGFVDLHCHGGGGASYADGDTERLAAAVTAHRRHGTTTTLASLVSRPLPELIEQIGRLADLVDDGLLAGIHLEGPFISSARCGAHDAAVLCPPDRTAVARLLDAGRGTIRMVTIAPELEGGIDAVRQLSDAGVIAAIGHTDGDDARIRAAVDAGATVATHLFNQMPPLHHRDPGPVGALLDDDRVNVELICDLVLVHPTMVRIAARHAGPERTVLVTDAMAAAAYGDGRFMLGTLPVTVRKGRATVDGTGVLAASTLTLDAAVRNFVRDCGMTVRQAVAAASERPAHLLGQSGRIGAIQPGAAADFAVLDENLHLKRVMHQGRWI